MHSRHINIQSIFTLVYSHHKIQKGNIYKFEQYGMRFFKSTNLIPLVSNPLTSKFYLHEHLGCLHIHYNYTFKLPLKINLGIITYYTTYVHPKTTSTYIYIYMTHTLKSHDILFFKAK